MGDESIEVLGVECPACGAGIDTMCTPREGDRGAAVLHLERREALREVVAQVARNSERRRDGAKLYEWSVPPDYPECLYIAGKECTVWIQIQPFNADRGRYRATLDCWGKLGASFDHQDGWPRYYTNLERAKGEILDWIRLRERSDAEVLAQFNPAKTDNPMVICDGVGCGCEIISAIPAAGAWTVMVVEPSGTVGHLGGKFCTGCLINLAKCGLTLHPTGKPRHPPRIVDCFVCHKPAGLWAMGDRYLTVCPAHAARFAEAAGMTTMELIAERDGVVCTVCGAKGRPFAVWDSKIDYCETHAAKFFDRVAALQRELEREHKAAASKLS